MLPKKDEVQKPEWKEEANERVYQSDSAQKLQQKNGS